MKVRRKSEKQIEAERRREAEQRRRDARIFNIDNRLAPLQPDALSTVYTRLSTFLARCVRRYAIFYTDEQMLELFVKPEDRAALTKALDLVMNRSALEIPSSFTFTTRGSEMTQYNLGFSTRKPPTFFLPNYATQGPVDWNSPLACTLANNADRAIKYSQDLGVIYDFVKALNYRCATLAEMAIHWPSIRDLLPEEVIGPPRSMADVGVLPVAMRKVMPDMTKIINVCKIMDDPEPLPEGVWTGYLRNYRGGERTWSESGYADPMTL